MSKAKYQNLTGMHDVLPEDQVYMKKLNKAVESVANYYGFSKIETPILEQAEIFLKAVGADTDIVGKEMYSFRTKGGDMVCLRPEGTAGIMRSYIEHGMHNLPQPVKLWYIGPFFRYEKPQAGRFRQFHQFGFEALGEQNPSIDGQIIQMSYDVLKELGLKNTTIEVNSIGDSECRPYFKKILTSYFRSRKSSLCSDCQRRLKENPGKVLDIHGEEIGKHDGVWFYTIGQRGGWEILPSAQRKFAGKGVTPVFYVVSKDAKKNILTVALENEAGGDQFQVGEINRISKTKWNLDHLIVRIRHGGELIGARGMETEEGLPVILDKELK